jgi:hypothetical protein
MNKIEKIPEINERIMQVIDYYSNKNVTKFANSIEITQQTLNRLFIIDKRTGKYPLATTEIIKKISEMYDINANWILTGDGEMLKKSSNISTFQPPNKFQNTTQTSPDQVPVIKCLLCKEKDERIADLKEMNASYKVIIDTQQSMIQSLQDHIDDLQQPHFDADESTPSRTG